MISAFFAKAGPDGGTLLLDDGSFVGNSLCCTHITNKLLHCGGECQLAFGQNIQGYLQSIISKKGTGEEAPFSFFSSSFITYRNS